MILVTFATLTEAEQSIKMLKASPLDKACFRFDQGYLLITGIGAHASQQAISSFTLPFQTIWNFGIAGSLINELQLEEVVCISSIYKASIEKDRFSAFPPFQINPLGHTLVTSDIPIHSMNKRKTLAKTADVVDMEGYGLAYSAFAMKKPLLMWKLISDFANNEAKDLIEKQLSLYSSKLATCLSEILSCQK